MCIHNNLPQIKASHPNDTAVCTKYCMLKQLSDLET